MLRVLGIVLGLGLVVVSLTMTVSLLWLPGLTIMACCYGSMKGAWR